MGKRADSLEREIVSTREQMGRTIDLMERQLRRTVDWQTRLKENPLPYILGALAVGFLLAGGPRRTVKAIAGLRPPKKTRAEKILESLPEPLAERLSGGVSERLDQLLDIPDNFRKQVRQLQREREKEAQKRDEERLRRAARATMLERVAIKSAEAIGTAMASIAMKQLVSRMQSGSEG